MPTFSYGSPAGDLISYRFDHDVVTVGRAFRSDFVLHHTSVSRIHAEVRRKENQWILHDVGSRHGTLVNRRRVSKPTKLRDGDEIAFGNVTLFFHDSAPECSPEAQDRSTTTHEVRLAQDAGGGVVHTPVLVGRSKAMRSVLATVDRVAPSDVTVLITGETGTGKELVARLVHHRSARGRGPFVAVNCPALPGSLIEAELFGVERGVATGVDARPGRLETAGGGTLLLDEIGDLEPAGQAKILRFLEDKKIERIGGRAGTATDVRVLAATNHDLRADIGRGVFRMDLYQRLNTIKIHLPPLRERRDDIPPLVEHFLKRYSAIGLTLDSDALDRLMSHDFPGNVRELERIVRGALLLCETDIIRAKDLPLEPDDTQPCFADATVNGIDHVSVLYERIVRDRESFWDLVQTPYLRRDLSKEAVQSLIERGYEEAGGTYKKLAGLFHVKADHRRLVNFIYSHGLQAGRKK